ncbi:MAG TPA: cyanophycin synthetase [Solirubrobacter sp.]|nr:cyanophycin synthetase [Solirubrobacter sp.]
MSAWDLSRAEAHLLSLELFGMRFGLERMRRLLTALGSPQERFRAVHVVGTNGKSSTVRFTAALLEAHGVRTGAYLSPHLTSYAERIRVGDADVSGADFAAAVQRAAAAAAKVDRTLTDGERVTQFELLTAAAFSEFARREIEVAVVEAGLGGRYDATNVLGADVVVLTNVGLEHTRWLGPTIADIAGEKLAVVRSGATLVLGDTAPEVEALARATGATIVRPAPAPAAGASAAAPPRAAGDSAAATGDRPAASPRAAGDSAAATGDRPAGPSRAAGDLAGALPGYQRGNFALAEAAAAASLGRPLDPAAVARAAAVARVPGRLQVVAHDPLTIFDGAHNAPGIAALADSVPDGTVAVLSILDDKDAAAMLRALLPRLGAAVFTRAPNPRALPPATLADLADKVGGVRSEIEPDPRRALERARELAGPQGTVLATGSIYLVAELISQPGERRASAL